MNKRQIKKRDKKAIELARKINFLVDSDDNMTFWKYNSRIKRSDMKYNHEQRWKLEELKHGYINFMDARRDFKEELKSKEMLLKVCRKSLQDSFPLEEYMLWEIPYHDKNGWTICFVHKEDYFNCHRLNKKDTPIREIDFWCPHNALKAIPQGLDKNSNQYDCQSCFDAVYAD